MSDSQIYKRYTEKSCEPLENFEQYLNNGQPCTDNRNCMSQNCTRKQDSDIQASGGNTFSQCLLDCECLGKEEGVSCTNSYDCHLGTACIYDDKWPFHSTCQKLRGDDEACHYDTDCKLTHYCWYKSPQDALENTKKCMPMYSQADGTKFGYLKDPT